MSMSIFPIHRNLRIVFALQLDEAKAQYEATLQWRESLPRLSIADFAPYMLTPPGYLQMKLQLHLARDDSTQLSVHPTARDWARI